MTIDTYERHESAFEEWRAKPRTAPTSGRITVSDHAMLRFLERACGIEVDAMREYLAGILDPMIGAANVTLTHNGLRFVVKENVVLTVYPTKGSVPVRHRVRREA